LPQASGRKKQSVALARTVLQRRLASLTQAIAESLRRRFEKQGKLLEELESLAPAQRAKRLAQIQGRIADAEHDEDDLDDAARDLLTDEFTTAIELDQLRAEIAALRDLLAQARRVRDHATDSKLTALRDCLTKAEFNELKDGKGRLLIFTEHRDTLTHLLDHLNRWGYSTCQIHGGMNPHERKRAQEDFRTSRQISVATEAAGEGINLQFCRLMINYDLPWNPARLEQRLGRIHRIGQERDVHAFNFVASESEQGQDIIEGRILERLLQKMEQMRSALADRVFDVIGEVLSLNDVNLPEILREAANDPRRLDEYLDQIERVDPQRLLQSASLWLREREYGPALAHWLNCHRPPSARALGGWLKSDKGNSLAMLLSIFLGMERAKKTGTERLAERWELLSAGLERLHRGDLRVPRSKRPFEIDSSDWGLNFSFKVRPRGEKLIWNFYPANVNSLALLSLAALAQRDRADRIRLCPNCERFFSPCAPTLPFALNAAGRAFGAKQLRGERHERII